MIRRYRSHDLHVYVCLCLCMSMSMYVYVYVYCVLDILKVLILFLFLAVHGRQRYGGLATSYQSEERFPDSSWASSMCHTPHTRWHWPDLALSWHPDKHESSDYRTAWRRALHTHVPQSLPSLQVRKLDIGYDSSVAKLFSWYSMFWLSWTSSRYVLSRFTFLHEVIVDFPTLKVLEEFFKNSWWIIKQFFKNSSDFLLRAISGRRNRQLLPS